MLSITQSPERQTVEQAVGIQKLKYSDFAQFLEVNEISDNGVYFDIDTIEGQKSF